MPTRVPLHDPATLRWIMKHPGRGTPFSVRTLAAAARCNPATIGHLLSGRYRRTSEDTARRITEALGCELAAVFVPSSSTDLDESIS